MGHCAAGGSKAPGKEKSDEKRTIGIIEHDWKPCSGGSRCSANLRNTAELRDVGLYEE